MYLINGGKQGLKGPPYSKQLQYFFIQSVSMYPLESVLGIGTVHSALTAGGRVGFCPGPLDETLQCCIYRRLLYIFNAEEGMGPLETLLLRHYYHIQPSEVQLWCLICYRQKSNEKA